MRRLTRSILGFGLALPAFGLEQMSRIGSRQARESMADALDSVTAALCEDLGRAPKGLFEVGSNLQNGMVDMAFSVARLGLGSGTVSQPGTSAEASFGVCSEADPSAGPTGVGIDPSEAPTGIDRIIGGPSTPVEGAGGWGPVPSRQTLPWPDPVDGWGPMPGEGSPSDGADPPDGEP